MKFSIPYIYKSWKREGTVILSLFTLLFFQACSSANESTKLNNIKPDDDKTYFSFKTHEDGVSTRWKVEFQNDEISALYRNEKQIPDDRINDYEDMIYEKLSEIHHNNYDRRSTHNIDVDIDMDSLEEGLERMAEELSRLKIHVDFDEDNFNDNMEKLEKELEKLKDLDIDIHIDPETFNENMKDLEENLKDIRVNIPQFHFDKEKFDTNIKELMENLNNENYVKNNKFKIDMNCFHKNMKSFKNKMNKTKASLSEMDTKLNRLHRFIDKLKVELVKDGVIKTEDEDIEISFYNDALEINDIKVSDELFDKYSSLYKESYGEALEGDLHLYVQ